MWFTAFDNKAHSYTNCDSVSENEMYVGYYLWRRPASAGAGNDQIDLESSLWQDEYT